jgi:hypothetical protein
MSTTRERLRTSRRNGHAAPASGRAHYATDGTAAAPRAWASDARAAAGLNVLAGIWLIISPFVLGYGSGDATWNPIVFGAIVTTLAFVRAVGGHAWSALSWINMAIGVWLFISAFWLASTAKASWDVGVLGVVVFLLAAWSASASGGSALGRSSAL